MTRIPPVTSTRSLVDSPCCKRTKRLVRDWQNVHYGASETIATTGREAEVPIEVCLQEHTWLTCRKAYQQDLFREIQEEDGLVIMARGLGVPRIIANLLHVYDTAGDNLVLIIGAGERENKWIGDSMCGNQLDS